MSIDKSTRKLTSVTFSAFMFATLLGCSSNTIIDDGAYRTIGGGSPRNPHPSLPEGLSADPQLSMDADSGFSATGDFAYEGGIPKGSLSNGGPSTTGHVKRYGNGGAIEKIAKIARIHCQPRTFDISTKEQSFWGKRSGKLTQCTYRFPSFCGAHQFSVLTYGKKEVLIFNQPDSPYYIIDALKGTHASTPGLWDKDDKIGSKASNMSYMFESEYDAHQLNQHTPLNLGWVIKASHHDEVQHGSRYHQAITDTTQCF